MRLVIVLAATAALSLPALAQQPRPPAPAQPRPPAAQPQPPAPPPGMFPCRAAGEVCHVGVATSASQVVILYSNGPQGQAAEGKAISVQGADLAPHVGKVVMLTGELSASGVSGAQVVDVGGPLLSFAIKLQLGGGDDGQQSAAPARGAPPPRGGPPSQAPRR